MCMLDDHTHFLIKWDIELKIGYAHVIAITLSVALWDSVSCLTPAWRKEEKGKQYNLVNVSGIARLIQSGALLDIGIILRLGGCYVIFTI